MPTIAMTAVLIDAARRSIRLASSPGEALPTSIRG
jgi:hypothetical protein